MFHVEQFMQDQCSISIRVSIRSADKLFISPCLYTSQSTQQGEEGCVNFIKNAEINTTVLLLQFSYKTCTFANLSSHARLVRSAGTIPSRHQSRLLRQGKPFLIAAKIPTPTNLRGPHRFITSPSPTSPAFSVTRRNKKAHHASFFESRAECPAAWDWMPAHSTRCSRCKKRL